MALGICTACIYLIFGNVILPLEQLSLRRRVNWSRHVLYILSGIGTLLVAVFLVFVPFGLTLHLMKRAADDDKFLRYSDGLIILVCSIVALLQLSPFASFWFWTWSAVHRPVSGYLLGLFAIMNALTATFGFAVFCCEIYFRNIRRIAIRRFPDDTEESAAKRALESVGKFRRVSRLLFWTFTTSLLCAVFMRLPCTTTRELLGIVDDYLEQVVDESGQATLAGMEPGPPEMRISRYFRVIEAALAKWSEIVYNNGVLYPL